MHFDDCAELLEVHIFWIPVLTFIPTHLVPFINSNTNFSDCFLCGFLVFFLII